MMSNRATWVAAAACAALGMMAGCSSGDDPSMFPPSGDRAQGFSTLDGTRSDAPLGRKLEDDGDDFEYEFREHLAKQDPRWRDRDFRERERARIRMEVEREQSAKRRAAARRGNGNGDGL